METPVILNEGLQKLRDLVAKVSQQSDCRRIAEGMRAGLGATFDNVVGAFSAVAVAALAGAHDGPLLIVTKSDQSGDLLASDLKLFVDEVPDRFAAWDTALGERLIYDATYGDRLRMLKALLRGVPPSILVASIQSLLQPVPQAAAVAESTRTINVGDRIDLDELCSWLAERGFHAATGVELPGEFARRGAILDVFAADWNMPARIEFFGDDIESIRDFEVGTQRSSHPRKHLDLTVLRSEGDDPMRASGENRGHLVDYLPANTWIVFVEPEQVQTESRHFEERVASREGIHTAADVMKRLANFPACDIWSLAPTHRALTWSLDVTSVQRFSGRLEHVKQQLLELSDHQFVLLVCSTQGEIERLQELFLQLPIYERGALQFVLGELSAGFQSLTHRTIVLSSRELFQRDEVQRRQPKRHLGQKIDSFLDLREGDLVVHLGHGIGRYRGMKLLQRENQVEEHLTIEFHAGTKLYVPSTKIDLVQKYVGGTKSKPRLATIGGATWAKHRKAAESATVDLAAELLQLQAQRAARPGIAFAPDTLWQREFDEAFPYQETDDQLSAIEAIKNDMELPRPMDRLLCGDVGFGKTEVALRAIFKAVDNGYQVAVLVPTTILAEQHYHTFQNRLAEFPFGIARLSRFCDPAEEREIIENIKKGAIDIVIGTHRLASADIEFQNLGLLVIDEEQRFGVEVKERLKSMRSTVDVLTMTATPIPRTLHMSLTGMRDISNLEMAPQERVAVETRLLRWHDDIIRQAILRELNRGGQVYFVHNRIQDMPEMRARLQTLVPEASIRIGHGQMHEDDLECVMVDFVAGQFDVLLATTIVESGLDIPNANTIFIDQSDKYGLADLHQLRGRVGRYNRHAYCYLLVDARKPITPQAARRLQALEEFSSLGAGFAISMRDLEFRGAGNILGAQQSGHIAAVGYEMYCQLLETAVRRMRHLPPKLHIEVNVDLPGTARFPESYMPDQRTRIDFYRRLTRVESADDVRRLGEELRDRFGAPPPEAARMLDLAGLKVEAAIWQIHTVRVERQGTEHFLVFEYSDSGRIRQLSKRSGGALRVVDERTAYATLHKSDLTPQASLAVALKLLR
jgi:transcription-repair coupling factor (superfamily II helicase)